MKTIIKCRCIDEVSGKENQKQNSVYHKYFLLSCFLICKQSALSCWKVLVCQKQMFPLKSIYLEYSLLANQGQNDCSGESRSTVQLKHT